MGAVSVGLVAGAGAGEGLLKYPPGWTEPGVCAAGLGDGEGVGEGDGVGVLGAGEASLGGAVSAGPPPLLSAVAPQLRYFPSGSLKVQESAVDLLQEIYVFESPPFATSTFLPSPFDL